MRVFAEPNNLRGPSVKQPLAAIRMLLFGDGRTHLSGIRGEIVNRNVRCSGSVLLDKAADARKTVFVSAISLSAGYSERSFPPAYESSFALGREHGKNRLRLAFDQQNHPAQSEQSPGDGAIGDVVRLIFGCVNRAYVENLLARCESERAPNHDSHPNHDESDRYHFHSDDPFHAVRKTIHVKVRLHRTGVRKSITQRGTLARLPFLFSGWGCSASSCIRRCLCRRAGRFRDSVAPWSAKHKINTASTIPF